MPRVSFPHQLQENRSRELAIPGQGTQRKPPPSPLVAQWYRGPCPIPSASWGLAMGTQPWGVLAWPRYCQAFLFRGLAVFFLCPRVLQLISSYPALIKSDRALTFPARTSPELKSSLVPGCQQPQGQGPIFI